MDGTYCGASYSGGYSRTLIDIPAGIEIVRIGVDSNDNRLVDDFVGALDSFCLFVDKNERLPSHKRGGVEESKLRKWFDTWHREYSDGNMPKDRLRQWESKWQLCIGGIGAMGFKREKIRIQCLAYVHSHGLLPTKRVSPELAKGIAQVRESYQRGALTNVEVKKFEDIPGWYWSKADEWRRDFIAVKTSYENHSMTKEDVSWVLEQSSLLERCKLKEEYKNQLSDPSVAWIFRRDIPKTRCLPWVRVVIKRK